MLQTTQLISSNSYFIILLVLYSLLTLGSVRSLTDGRSHCPAILHRTPTILFVQTVCNVMIVAAILIDVFLINIQIPMPCSVHLWVLALCLPVFIVCRILAAMHLIAVSRASLATLEAEVADGAESVSSVLDRRGGSVSAGITPRPSIDTIKRPNDVTRVGSVKTDVDEDKIGPLDWMNDLPEPPPSTLSRPGTAAGATPTPTPTPTVSEDKIGALDWMNNLPDPPQKGAVASSASSVRSKRQSATENAPSEAVDDGTVGGFASPSWFLRRRGWFIERRLLFVLGGVFLSQLVLAAVGQFAVIMVPPSPSPLAASTRSSDELEVSSSSSPTPTSTDDGTASTDSASTSTGDASATTDDATTATSAAVTDGSLTADVDRWQCISRPAFLVAAIPVILYTLILLALLTFQLTRVREQFGIRLEVILLLIIIPVQFIVGCITFALPDSVPGDTRIYLLTVTMLLTLTFIHVVNVAIPAWQLRKETPREPSMSKQGLMELLNRPAGMQEFKQFAAKEFSAENVLFYQRCLALPTSTSPMQCQARLRRIYQLHCLSSSPLPLNLVHSTMKKIRQDFELAGEYGEVPENVFEKAISEVVMLMFKDTYPRFLTSKRRKRDSRVGRWDQFAQGV